MTILSVFVGTSLDGCIAREDGSLDWLEAAGRSDEDYGFDAFLGTVDALAMGRGTYDHIAHIDPLPFGDRPVYVFTHRPPAPRAGVTFWQQAPEAALALWRAAGHGRVYVDGGHLITAFLACGLIDEFTISVAPVILGRGRPLFGAMDDSVPLRLVGAQTWPSGFSQTRYVRIGADGGP